MLNIFSLKRKLFFKREKFGPADWIIRICLYLIVFLTPIFFLPYSAVSLELNKIFIFGLLVIIASVAYLAKIIIKKEGSFLRTIFDWLFLILLMLYIISTILSVHHVSSLWGIDSYYSGSLASLILFILFFYLIVNNIDSIRETVKLIIIFLISAAILMLFNVLQLKGVYIFSMEFTKAQTFNALVNSTEILSIFLAVSSLLLFGLLLFVKNIWQRIGLLAGFLLNFLVLFLLDKNISWVVLAAGVFIFLILVTLKSRELKSYWVIAPTVFLTLAILFIFINTTAATKLQLPNDAVLDQKTSWTITGKTIAKSPFWGTGPETFAYNFEKYRTVAFNSSELWSWRFIKASDEWSQLFSTVGVVAGLVFFIIGILYLINSISAILKAKKSDFEWLLNVVIFATWFAVFLASFFIIYNFILGFLFWFLMALGINIGDRKWIKKINFSLRNSASLTFATTIIFFLVILGGAIYLFFMGKIWLADFYYLKADQAIAKTADIGNVKSYLNKAIDFYPQKNIYYFTLAQGLVTELQLESLQESPDSGKIQKLASESVEQAKKGVEVDKNNPVVYENLAKIYQNLYAQYNDAWPNAIQAYEKAKELEPQNPMVYFDIGQVRLVQAQTALGNPNITTEEKTKSLQIVDQAISDFQKAKDLKINFVDADYYMALALDLKGEKEQAIKIMESLVKDYPDNLSVLYALGTMYLNNNQLSDAITEFDYIISLQPNHANAHWQLGIIYEKQGQKDKAIAEFETVQKLNPDNATVRQKLEELKK